MRLRMPLKLKQKSNGRETEIYGSVRQLIITSDDDDIPLKLNVKLPDNDYMLPVAVSRRSSDTSSVDSALSSEDSDGSEGDGGGDAELAAAAASPAAEEAAAP